MAMRRAVALAFVSCFMLPCAQTSGNNANPNLLFYGGSSIVAVPNPAVVEEVTSIDVSVGNSGVDKAESVEVSLSFNNWGITFYGWQLIGTQTVDIDPSGSVTLGFTHVFEDRAHTCLEAKIVGAGTGGNTNTLDDRGQINLEVVYVGAEDSYAIPFRNDADKAIKLGDVKFGCLDPNFPEGAGTILFSTMKVDTFPECSDNEVRFEAPPEMKDGLMELEGRGEAIGYLHIKFGEAKNANNGEGWQYSDRPNLQAASGVSQEVLVQAKDLETGEVNHVVVTFVKTTVPALLNQPHLCDIKSVKTRVQLETMLASALEAYEAKEPEVAAMLLQKFVTKAELVECDMSTEEKAAVERAAAVATDAARMIAREYGSGLAVVTNGWIMSGDELRREGQRAAAIHSYRRPIRRL